MSLIRKTLYCKQFTCHNSNGGNHLREREREIIKKIDSTTLYAFRKYKFCLLPANKYRQNDSTLSLADQCILFSQKFDF